MCRWPGPHLKNPGLWVHGSAPASHGRSDPGWPAWGWRWGQDLWPILPWVQGSQKAGRQECGLFWLDPPTLAKCTLGAGLR